LSATSQISSTSTGEVFSALAATTAAAYIRLKNTGGDTFFGTDNSTGSIFGAGNNSSVIYSTTRIVNSISGNTITNVTGTGLAVTGALSSTTNISVTNGGSSVAGSMWANTSSGLIHQAKTGSTYDYQLINPAASVAILSVNTGTVNLLTGGNLTVAGALSATGNISVTKSTPKLTLTSSEDSDYNTTIENVYTNTAALLIKLRGNTVLSAGGIDGTKIFAPGVGVIGTFTSTGLGIGTASPRALLDIAGANTAQSLLIAEGTGNIRVGFGVDPSNAAMRIFSLDGIRFGKVASDGSTWTEWARYDTSGNLLVGTTSAISSGTSIVNLGSSRQVLTVKGDADASYTLGVWSATTSGDNLFSYFATEASITVRGAISYNRSMGLTVYGTTSDYRAKDISGPVTNSGALIDAVPVYMGKMKGATLERPMFIAHETPVYAHTGEKDAVDAEGKPVYQQIDTSALVPVLWAEIQSLRQRVAALESN
jgi:hypothetical protein